MTDGSAMTVAVSTRDRPEALARCLDSLFEGRVLPREVVIVDQSEGFETRGIATAAAPVPVVYVSQTRTGLAVAQNEAVRRASSPIVAVTDDDCVVAPDWLGTLAAAFAEDSSLDIVGGRVLPLREGKTGSYAVSLRVGEQRLELARTPAPWRLGSGNNFAVRRERFLAVGGCDGRLGPGAPGLGAMDMDLFYRLLRAGAHGRYEPGAVVLHARTTFAERRRRRFDYGYGMGACCALRLREGDAYSLRVLLAWSALRFGLLGRSLRGGNWVRAREEVLVLEGTARGLVFSPHRRRRGRS